ncbi:PIG-L family deacetylase [Mangrovimonas futianensis]|uniref:PIG-L family deacetylase n=1 Tax=Mangrovimonas futianensis TaxID=2895523 RepID=UPI001E61D9C3|nr:PIG-L family deacetylase [Mangrovimonas futianensis]MCF1422310.1 PIG-L family deacetylase [Mangrovimonas futianensis]
MKHNRQITIIMVTAVLAIVLSGCNREDVTIYAPIETYPNDTILEQLADKRAMIIIAHDDDMCAMSGTISLLNKKGWEIQVLSTPINPERDSAHQQACQKLLDKVTFFDFRNEKFRIDTANVTYNAIPKNQFHKTFNVELLAEKIIQSVNSFNPSVIFTLDNEIGGYGHPGHVVVSQTILDLAKTHRIHPQYIYQSVYTDHMETTIMNRHSKRMKSWGFQGDGWENAKKVYAVTGMPEPSVQINIISEAKSKMEYLMSYNERERKTMGFFIPAFEEYSAEDYFTIFNREFFRIIEIKNENFDIGLDREISNSFIELE